ncbi:MAG: beta-ketoacyl-ACP synthase II [Synergistales bacterium]|nr:beta-ketoacyl-ACP synthase II [Synergistales bacterium]
MRRVVVTGLGVVSPIGHGKDTYWEALEAGRSGIGPITHFDTEEFSVKIAAEVTDLDLESYMERKEIRRTDPVIHFAVAAADMAVKDAGLDIEDLESHKFGVYIGSGEGGIWTSLKNYETLAKRGPSRVSPFFVPMMISNMPAAYVAIRHNAKGPNICVVTACATATHTMGEAFETIRRGDADVVLAGGTESAITPISTAGFAAMKALSTKNDDPDHASRPFDRDRDGFVLGEGSGVLVLEDMEHAKKRGASILAEVRGYGSTCDAYHITAPDPNGDGAYRAMEMAVGKAGWTLDEVDLINTHGTSTRLNDIMEAQSIRRLFGEHTDRLLVNSTKSMVGHCLGAAGALEAIASIQSIVTGVVHPTLNMENLDSECPINVTSRCLHDMEVRRVLVNSFGFGGHNAVLALERFAE